MPDPNRPTQSALPADVERTWYVVDIGGKVLGRAASQIASVLRGKHKPIYTPHVPLCNGISLYVLIFRPGNLFPVV